MSTSSTAQNPLVAWLGQNLMTIIVAIVITIIVIAIVGMLRRWT